MVQIGKEIASFRCVAAVKYIQTLELNDKQIETLFDSLAEEIVKKQQTSLESNTIG